MPTPVTELELARLSALYRYGILDTAAESDFDGIAAELARRVGAPFAQITFVDATRLWDKAGVGDLGRDMPRRGSFAEILIDGKPTLVVQDTSREPDGWDTVAFVPPFRLKAFAGVRLATPGGEAVGVVSVADVRARSFGPGDLAALHQAAAQIQILLESRQRSRLDPTTGALGRVAFADQVRRMAEVTVSSGQSSSAVLLDLNDFRLQLDGLTSSLGRIVLRRLSDLARDQLRGRDCFGRLGENRFGILLAGTGEEGASVLAKRFVGRITDGWSALPLAEPDAHRVLVGIASAKASPAQADTLLARAEQALASPAPDVAAQAKVA